MSSPFPRSLRESAGKRLLSLLCLCAAVLGGGWLWQHASAYRLPTPEAAASAGLLGLPGFDHPPTELRWTRASERAGVLGRHVELVGHRGQVQVASATLNSLLWFGWQLEGFSIIVDQSSLRPHA